MRVLYIFSGDRRRRFQGVPGRDFPDTQFYGMNHLGEIGVPAEYKEFEDYPLGRYIARIIGFRAKHSLMYFVARHYDVVFGISVIYMLIWKKLFPTKTKFVIFNSVFTRMMNTYGPRSIKFKLLTWILKEVDGIVFLAHVDMEKVASRIPSIAHKLYFVAMGSDAAYYQPKFENRKRFFLSVGRDNARDYKTLVEVAKRLPHEEFHFVCLPRNIEGLHIPDNVRVHINIPRKEMEELYDQAKALLLITHHDSYTQGSDSSGPTVLLEAMAKGLPVIASRKGYMSDYVQDSEDALLVDFYDVDAIVGHIRTLSNEKMALQIAKSARSKIDTIFNTREMANGLARVFETIYEQ